MFLRIETIDEKKLVGQSLTMSFGSDRTRELWRSFMPRRNEIRNTIGDDMISMQVYPDHFDFNKFDPAIYFQKCAAVEVSGFEALPEGMETMTLPSGLYAVFLHKGPASDGQRTFNYIFGVWLPASEFQTDSRPHFEVLGEKYKNNDPASEEEIWIPIRRK